MAKFRSFALWVEDQAATGAYNPQATGEYIPNQALQSTGNEKQASTAPDPEKTIDYRGPGRSSPIDPEVAQTADSLHTIHGQLRDIFAAIRAKAQAFHYPKMRGAFERELTAGVDGVGRAHAILLPSARGAEHDSE